MRLRELRLPIAVMHSDFLGVVNAWDDMFEHVSLESTENGYFSNMTVFDADGTEYKAGSVIVLSRSRLASLFSSGVRIDIELRRVTAHSSEELKNRFRNYLEEHPSWWMNNEGVWRSQEVEGGLGRGNNCHEVIERLGWFSREII